MEYLAITVLGARENHIPSSITEIVTDLDCFVSQAQCQSLGIESAFSLLITGNWNNIARLETALSNLAVNKSLLMSIKRTQRFASEHQLLPYSIQVIAIDQIGTVYNICNFFSSRNITIENLTSETYLSNTTSTPMLTVNLSVSLPSYTNIAELREQFLIFCDDLNIDGILEPDKR